MAKKRKKHSKIKYKLITPFGPTIMSGQMPKDIFEEFESVIDEVLEKQSKNHGDHLAGRIDDEWHIDEGYFQFGNLGPFLDSIVAKYTSSVVERFAELGAITDKERGGEIEIGVTPQRLSGWVNSMKSGEYNPVHHHPQCNITTVFFFDDMDEDFVDDIIAPTQTDTYFTPDAHRKGTTDDGTLQIFYNTNHYYEIGSFTYRPKKGTFLIFPAFLSHGVNPFISKKRRRTASINYIVTTNNNNTTFGAR